MLDFTIRKAVLDDSKELCGLADELIHLRDESSRKAMLEVSLRDPDCDIYVAEDNGIVAGFVEMRVLPDFVEGAPIAVIQNLVVKETHRRLGIGTKLIDKALEEAKDRNVKETHVWTEFNNKPAIRFYAKCGFERRALLLEKRIDGTQQSRAHETDLNERQAKSP